MSFYTGSNITISGGSSTYVAGNVNYYTGTEGHDTSDKSAAFKELCKEIAPNALHNSGEVSDQPKCHPGTRTAILDYLISWACALSYSLPIIWLHGPAGAGKSAILRTVAQILYEKQVLLASFFFFRTGSRRNTSNYFIATIAYQLALSIPETRQYIVQAIERNPVIFSLSLWDQALALVVSPLVSVFYDPSSNPRNHPRVILIDGLDECTDPAKQQDILQVLNRIIEVVPLPLAILIGSRPEHHLRESFNIGTLSRRSSRLALDDSFDPDSDIRKYLVDRFEFLRHHHPRKSLLCSTWPSQDAIAELVAKASGQFIFVATVDKFVSSPRHNPAKRLDIVLGTLGKEGLRPFEQLDNLYSTIFQTIEEDLESTLRVIGVLLVPHFNSDPAMESRGYSRAASQLKTRSPSFIEHLLGLEHGDVRGLLFDLESLLAVTEDSEDIQIFHASLSDYLFDQSRSRQFWVDAELIYADLAEQCIRHLNFSSEIREFFMWNSHLFFSRATPTNRLCCSIQNLDLHGLVAGSFTSGPHGLRDLCPTLLQAVTEDLRIPNATEVFSLQIDQFRDIVETTIRDIYLPSLPLAALIVSIPLKFAEVDTILHVHLRLSEAEEMSDRTLGFNLIATQSPKLHPRIRATIETQVRDNNSACFVSANQCADVVLYILECIAQDYYGKLPTGSEFFQSLFSNCSRYPGLVQRLAEIFASDDWKARVGRNLKQHMQTYFLESSLLLEQPSSGESKRRRISRPKLISRAPGAGSVIGPSSARSRKDSSKNRRR